jgi:DNA-3-methyladenine glycosylase II
VPKPVRLTRGQLARAEAHLRAADPKLAAAMEAVGRCTLLPRREGTHFEHLARAIVYQQLSGKAAATIHGRVCDLLGGPPSPPALGTVTDDALRAAGLSMGKLRAIRDLAAHVSDGRLPLDDIEHASDEAVIEALVQVRGIGEWTAQMFLMFRLGRPDVLPVLDLGVRKGAQRIHRTRTLPDAERLAKIARRWQPWRSVASWYCWRVLDLPDATQLW